MIDFACKEFKLSEVIKCGLGLSKADFDVMDSLLENDEDSFTTEQLAKTLNLNLSTVQRAMKKLFEKDIVERKQVNLDNGGYSFVYQIRSRSEIRTIIMKIVHSWSKKVEEELKKW